MRRLTIAVACVLLLLGSSISQGASSSPFEVVWDDSPLELKAGSGFRFQITIRAPLGHYLYADETEVDFVSLEGLRVTDIRYPKPVLYTDPYLGKKVRIYRGDVNVEIIGRIPKDRKASERDLIASLSFRGCSPKVCFRPEERKIAFRLNIVPAAAESEIGPKVSDKAGDIREAARESGTPSIRRLLKVKDFGELASYGPAIVFLIVFLAGVLTSLTPCIWPILPVVLLYIGVHPHKKISENFALSASLVAGLILVYSALGVAAAAFGKNLGFLFQSRVFLALVVLFFLAMSLSMFGVFDLRLPRRLHERLHKLGGKGYRGAFLAGMGMGLVASPCSGPVLGALLGYVALQRDYAAGFVYLVVYGVGLGILVLLVGTGYGELAGKIKGGPWMLWVRRALGLILLFPAAFYMGSLFQWRMDLLSQQGDRPRIEWIMSEADALRFAKENRRPVMIEFSAKWCPPCIALDKRFFERDEIVKLSYQLVPLQADATVETKEVRRLIEKYSITGWPSVVFLSPEGSPYDDLKVSDYDAEAIERGMRAAIERAMR